MLVLTRREGESFTIIAPDGTEISVKFLGNNSPAQAKIGVEAPKSWPVLRIDREGEIEPGQLT